MKFTISEIFCEVISAVGFVVAMLPLLICLDLTTLESVRTWIMSMTGTNLLAYLLVAYIFGVFLNIVGLPADKLLSKFKFAGQEPNDTSRNNFYKNASAHLFHYRTNAWNHYYCFRNLLFFFPFSILWLPVLYEHVDKKVFVALILTLAITGVTLFFAAKQHLEFYWSVTKSYD